MLFSRSSRIPLPSLKVSLRMSVVNIPICAPVTAAVFQETAAPDYLLRGIFPKSWDVPQARLPSTGPLALQTQQKLDRPDI